MKMLTRRVEIYYAVEYAVVSSSADSRRPSKHVLSCFYSSQWCGMQGDVLRLWSFPK